MIGALRGKVWRKLENAALIDCSGVGYLVAMSSHGLAKLAVGEEVEVDVHTHVREDQIALFGFVDVLEKDLFSLLLSVSGVGPKMALNVLSGLPAADFVAAVSSENLAVLTKIPGVGKKTAERLLLELKTSVKQLGIVPSSAAPAGSTRASLRGEVASALLNLGYKPAQVEAVADRLVKDHPDLGFEALVREALKALR
jgi:holliday junction DNA helicase RuvA